MPERGVPHAEGTATPCTEPDPPMPSETCPDALSGKGPELGARRPASAPFPKKKTRGYPHRSDMRGSCVFAGGEGDWKAAEVGRVFLRGGSVGLGVLPPSSVFRCPTAPGTGCLGFSAENPLPDQSLVPLKSRPGLRPPGVSFASLRQLTTRSRQPCSRGLSGPSALSPRSLADWLSGTPAAALRPKASRRAGLRGGDGGLRAGLRLAPLELRATGVAYPARAWQGLQRPRPFGIPHSRRRTRFCQ